MKTTRRHTTVLVTAPDIKTARNLAQASLSQRLVACANILPKIESHYWWQGKLEQSNEVLVIFKTTKTLLPRLAECIRANHPYDTPEIIALPIQAGSSRYLAWIDDSTQPPADP
ncbi:MAG: divalent-cation tolerance protein CutA [Limisphaerales bacterium]|jgi:periplasmic divalent cation tolerance protein